MHNKFDDLAKNLAQSVTRRAALKQFGVGLAGLALACFGLADMAQAGDPRKCQDTCSKNCRKQFPVGSTDFQTCYSVCLLGCPW